MATTGWRAEDVISILFEFKFNEKLDPRPTQCLTLNRLKSGQREEDRKRCGWNDPQLRDGDRCRERRELVASFKANKTLENPSNFKEAVMRFIELSCCQNAPNFKHVTDMEDKAQEWFVAHAQDGPQTWPMRDPATTMDTTSQMITRSQARQSSTSPAMDIEMRKYTIGREDPEYLLKSIEENLDERKREFETGLVYISSSSRLPGYVKIGWTAKATVQARFRDAKQSCDLDIKFEYATERITYAKRLETMVHNELADWRYRFASPCTFCHEDPEKPGKPGKKHNEWFKTTVDHAKKSMMFWAERIYEGMYDEEECNQRARRSASPEVRRERQRSFSPELQDRTLGTIAQRFASPSTSGKATSNNSSSEYFEPRTSALIAAEKAAQQTIKGSLLNPSTSPTDNRQTCNAYIPTNPEPSARPRGSELSGAKAESTTLLSKTPVRRTSNTISASEGTRATQPAARTPPKEDLNGAKAFPDKSSVAASHRATSDLPEAFDMQRLEEPVQAMIDQAKNSSSSDKRAAASTKDQLITWETSIPERPVRGA